MISPLISYIKQHGDGRTYAGLPNNWGHTFTVGFVPVYKYIESEDVDEVTYVVPTLSLMLDPETNFDEDNPSDYTIFGVRYLLLPVGMTPPVPAQPVMEHGIYRSGRSARTATSTSSSSPALFRPTAPT